MIRTNGAVQVPQLVDRAQSIKFDSSAFGRLPLSFEANNGQSDSEVRFLARGAGYGLFLTATEAVICLQRFQNGQSEADPPRTRKKLKTRTATHDVLRMKFLNANLASKITGIDELAGKTNYFIGNDPTKWQVNVSNYAKVEYKDVYEGIDLIYYGNQQQLEYDFVVAPGANPRDIKLSFEGIKQIRLDANGDLVLHTASGILRHHKPLIYQDGEEGRRKVSGGYALLDRNQVMFHLAEYDVTKPLIIDPVLSYSTYLGGSTLEGTDTFSKWGAISVDSSGQAYLTGITTSFPAGPKPFPTTTGSFQTTASDTEAFVTKLNATGTALAYSTLIGGSGYDGGTGLALDAMGNVFITGRTSSANFPTTPGVFQSQVTIGPGNNTHVFVTKLNQSGSGLIYSTYLAGDGTDLATSIAVDPGGTAYLSGSTSSTTFPVTSGVFQSTHNGDTSQTDGFITRLNATGTALIYSTYLGGNDYDTISSIAIDPAGNSYVTGHTFSSDFPITPGVIQTTLNSTPPASSSFVTKLNAAGAALVFSTYLGGSTVGYGIAVNDSGNAYVTGQTKNINFPTTASAFQTIYGGGDYDAFVSMLNPTGTSLVYSTFLGGSNNENSLAGGADIHVDNVGHAYVTGGTNSTNFPTKPGAFQSSLAGGVDVFVAKLNPAGTDLVESTYLGGGTFDYGTAIAIDSFGNSYVSGFTLSTNFPTTPNAFQSTNGGAYDAFITRIGLGIPYPPEWLFGHSPHSGFNADPVNTATGNYIFEHSDLLIAGRGLSFDFKRMYNSSDATAGPLGVGWTHSYNVALTDLGATASLRWDDGHVDVYNNSSGTYVPQNSGVFDKLVKNGDGTFTVTEKNQRKHKFSSAGKLTSIADRNNNTVTLNYDAGGKLASVTDTVGRSITFSYDPQGRIIQIADPLPRTISFSYDANNDLVSSTDANGKTTNYTYDANHRLLTATDPRGNTFVTNTYDAAGRVINQTDAKGNPTQFAYNTASGQTTITDALDKTSIDFHDVRSRLIKRQDRLGNSYTYTYDNNNNRVSVTDKNSKNTLYTYDSSGNVTGQTDPLSKTVAITYDSLNNPLTRTDELGKTTTFTYDANGNLLTSTGPLTNTTTFTYDSFGQLLTVKDANNNTTTNTFDSFGNLLTSKDPLNNTTTYAYDAVSRKTSTTNARNKTTLFTYDENNNLLTTTDPLNGITSFEYDENGNRKKITDPRNAVKTFTYDKNNLVLTATDALLGVVTNTYDAVNNRLTTKDARNNTTAFEYDDDQRLKKITDPLGNVTQYSYDGQGNRLTATDPKSKVTNFTYDALNRLTKTTDPLGNSTTSEYDALGRVIKSVDANNKTTQFTYDALGRLTQVTDANNGTAKYTYDLVGNRLTVVDPNNNTSTFTYDAVNRLATSKNPLNKIYSFGYDAVGNRTSLTDANGAVITYVYDDNDRLKEIDYPGPTSVVFTYDANGNRTQMVDSVGTSTYTYDALNRLTNYADAYGKTIGYAYDANGNRTTLTYPDSKQVTYAFDANNRLTGVTDWASRTTTYSYDAASLLTGITNSNTTTTSYSYDHAQRLINMANKKSDASTISSYAFTLDGVGNRTALTQNEPLTASLTPGTKNSTHDAANQIATDGSATFTFDNNGNQKSRVDGATTNYGYDFEDRLISVSDGTTSVQYVYNAVGQRLARTINGVTTRFVLDPTAGLPRLLAETDNSGNITVYYTHGLGLASRVTTAGQSYQYHQDARGSTIAITDSGQNVVNKYAYDPFGVIAASAEQQPNPFKYIGQFGVQSEPFDLLFASRRYYQPALGKFLTRDPAAASDFSTQALNQYVYSLNNPIRLFDPSGLIGQTDGSMRFEPRGPSDRNHRYLVGRSENSFSKDFWETLGKKGLEILVPELFDKTTVFIPISGGFAVKKVPIAGPAVGLAINITQNIIDGQAQNRDWSDTASRIAIDTTAAAVFALADTFAPPLGLAGSIGYEAQKEQLIYDLQHNPVTEVVGGATYRVLNSSRFSRWLLE